MAEGDEGRYEGIWVDGECKTPDDLRYNVEGRKNRCITREHADSFLKQSITTLARSEIKAAIKLRIKPHCPSLSN